MSQPDPNTVEFADMSGTAPLALTASATASGSVVGQPIGWSGSVLDRVQIAPDAEVVSANGTWTGIGAMNMQVLANSINTRGERMDPTVIEAMLDDPMVRACVDTRKLKMLCGELRFHPSVEEEEVDDEAGETEGGTDPAGAATEKAPFAMPAPQPDPAKPDHEEAKWAAEFCEYAHGCLETPIPIWAWGFSEYLVYGHKVAEKVLEEVEGGQYAGLYTLKALKIKGRWAYHICTDPYLNKVAIYAQTIWGPAYIDISHFFVMSNQPLDSDPRGTTILRGGKEPWRRKQRRLRSQTKGDDQFGTPSIVLTLPQNAPIESPNPIPGGPPIPTVTVANQQLQTFSGGGTLVVPFGTTVEVIESSRDGSQLNNSIDYDDREIARGILNNNGAGILEPEHYTQGSGDHAQAKERGLGDFDRDQLLAALKKQVFHYLLEVNFGREYADLYTPDLTMGAMPMDEFLKLATPASVLGQAGLLTPSQIEYVLLQAGIPRPKPGELRVGPSGPVPDELPPPPPPGLLPGEGVPPGKGAPGEPKTDPTEKPKPKPKPKPPKAGGAA